MATTKSTEAHTRDCLTDDEMQALSHAAWIRSTLGARQPMVNYFASMLIEQIRSDAEGRAGSSSVPDQLVSVKEELSSCLGAEI